MPITTPLQDSQPTTTAAPPPGPPKVPGADTSYQKRIDELYGQANYYKRELAELKERLAHQEGRSEAQQTQPQQQARGAPRTFQDMEDGELDKAWDYAMADDTKNPQILNQIVEEKVRRRLEKSMSQVTKETQKQIQQQQLLRDTNSRILQDFGAEAFQDGSELREAALEFMAQYIERYGKDSVSKSPDYQYDAFLRAERKLKTLSDRERMTQLEQENKALHTKASLLERGGSIGMASKPSNEVMEALKTGGTKEAIKRLNLTQNLVSDVKRRMVIREGNNQCRVQVVAIHSSDT